MGRDRNWGVRITTAECAVELRCSAGGVCSVALQCGFAVGCEDSEDTGFCPLRIIGCAPEQNISSQSLYLWALWGFLFWIGDEMGMFHSDLVKFDSKF